MITVNIATHSKRLPYLQTVVDALLEQKTKADAINIYFNDCEPPEWTMSAKKKYDCLNLFFGDDLGASAKFFSSENQNTGVYITIDDDLIPHPGYIGYLADSAMRYPDSIVGLHGTVYAKHPIKSYYTDQSKSVYYCYHGKTKNSCVDMLGTGALAFRATLPNKPVLSDFEAKNSTDPYLCKKAKDNKIALVCLVRANGFVKEISEAQDSAIWKGVAADDSKQTAAINSIKDFARVHTTPINTSLFMDWAVEWSHIKVIASVISRETNLVEFGSGVSTKYLSHFTKNITSFEHDKNFAAENVEVRPLKNGWYKLLKKDLTTISKADVIFIDGPIGKTGDRYNFPDNVIDKINPKAVIFIDDCQREKDLKQAKYIAKRLKKSIELIKGTQKILAKIK